MPNILERRLDASFDEIVSSLRPGLDVEGFRLMTDIEAQNDYKRRSDDGFCRYAVFVLRMNRLLDQSPKPGQDPAKRLSSNISVRELSKGGTELIVFDPTIPLSIEDDDIPSNSRDTNSLKNRLEDALVGFGDIETEESGVEAT